MFKKRYSVSEAYQISRDLFTLLEARRRFLQKNSFLKEKLAALSAALYKITRFDVRAANQRI